MWCRTLILSCFFGVLVSCVNSDHQTAKQIPAVPIATVQTPKPLTEVDLRIKGIGVGSSLKNVLATFGKPKKRTVENLPSTQACSHEREIHYFLEYEGLEISLLKIGNDKQPAVSSLVVNGGDWVASAISLGVNKARVIEVFGEPIGEKASDVNVLHYVTLGNLGGVNFEFQDDRLIRFSMKQTLC